MSETTLTVNDEDLDAAELDEAAEDVVEDDQDAEETDASTDDAGAEALGDAGKQALDRMKARLKSERERRRSAETELGELKAKSSNTDDPDTIRAEADKAATARANARIVRSEVKAAAVGRLADPKDALVFIDLAKFEVDEDGEVDEEEVREALDDLLSKKPHLAAATAKRFQGTGDGGARKGSAGPAQLTENDVKKMTPEQIDEAHRKGQLRDYLGG